MVLFIEIMQLLCLRRKENDSETNRRTKLFYLRLMYVCMYVCMSHSQVVRYINVFWVCASVDVTLCVHASETYIKLLFVIHA